MTKLSQADALSELERLLRTVDESLFAAKKLSWDHTGGEGGLDEHAFDAELDAAEEHLWNACAAYEAWAGRPINLPSESRRRNYLDNNSP
jgi:hypothetical protein